MKKDFELLEDIISSFFAGERRDVDNSGCITPAFYVNENARIDREHQEALAALDAIKVTCGVTE